MHGKIVSDLFGAAFEFNKNSVDATTVLQVQVGVKNVVASSVESHDGAEFDVFLLGDLQCVEFVVHFRECVGALGDNRFGHVLNE
ncbi:unannotated protein [freshwater metagenome]|uniref:Unannotated protein n=1 Tax=freshwater metagenome TaxID=449393 RepID=A0A6J6GQC0_9ZZZZ